MPNRINDMWLVGWLFRFLLFKLIGSQIIDTKFISHANRFKLVIIQYLFLLSKEIVLVDLFYFQCKYY